MDKPTIILPIGDLHIEKDDEKEADLIFDWIIDLANLHTSTGNNVVVLFLGDQYNTFGIMKVEVMNTLRRNFKKMKNSLSPLVSVFSLTGNHDMSQDLNYSAMLAHEDQISLIWNEPVFFTKTSVGIGYIRKESIFKEKVLDLYNKGARTVYCHTEFQGSQFENGFYAPHGFDLSCYPEDLSFVSGHIHKKQQFGNVFYPGTIRHLTRSDIGEIKGITAIYENRAPIFHPTPVSVSEPFVQIDIKEGEAIPEIKQSNRTYVNVVGTKDFIKKTLRDLPDSVKIKTEYTDINKKIETKESDGVGKAFQTFYSSFLPKAGTATELNEHVLREIFEKCPILKQGIK